MMLTALFAGSAFFCLRQCAVTDPDIWWHLRTGEWILNHGAVPHSDPFCSPGATRPWQAYSWIFELIVFKLFQRWDLLGLVSYITAMVVAITAALYHLVKRLQHDLTVAVLLTLGAMVCLTHLYTPRPWLFTILFFVLEIDVLMNVRRTGKARELLCLPLIFVVWANTHILFVYGLLVLGVAASEPIVARWWPEQQPRVGALKLWGISAVCILATLLNPYGWGIYKIAYALAAQHGVLTTVSELVAMSFRRLSDYAVLFLALAAAGALAWNRRFPVFETVSLAFAAALSFHSRREIWVLAVVATAVLASKLRGDDGAAPRLPALAAPFSAIAVGLAVFLGCAAVPNVNNLRLHAQVEEEMPVRAVQFVKDHSLSGPLYNTYSWGGFLLWNLPSIPVSIDGRSNIYGNDLIDRSIATWNADPAWASDPALLAARLVIGPVKAPLTQLLRTHTRFELVFEDKVAAVFIAREQPVVAVPAPQAGR